MLLLHQLHSSVHAFVGKNSQKSQKLTYFWIPPNTDFVFAGAIEARIIFNSVTSFVFFCFLCSYGPDLIVDLPTVYDGKMCHSHLSFQHRL